MTFVSLFLIMPIILLITFCFILLFFAIIIYLIIGYIFESIALTKISKDFGYKHTFTAFIPFYNKYILGNIAGNKLLGGLLGLINLYSFCQYVYCYFCCSVDDILYYILLFIGILIGFIIDIILTEKVFRKLTDKYIILTIFSVISFGILRPIFLFAIRNKKIIDDAL